MIGAESRTLSKTMASGSPTRWPVNVANVAAPDSVSHLTPDNLVVIPFPVLQELDRRRSTGAIYWEGAISLSEGGREVGRGYLEMTGYGERIRLG